jgi:AbrB family looped-hinge helix DNA binding protein
MTTQITIDSAGRVVIPKPLRDALDLAPGDTLDLESAGESITLRPTRSAVPLTKEKGVWVFRIGQPLDYMETETVLDQIRAERDLHNLGVES